MLQQDRLNVVTTTNAVPPMVRGEHALLTSDLWEHAYYLDYQNRRADYLEMFFEKLANWRFAADRLALTRDQVFAA